MPCARLAQTAASPDIIRVIENPVFFSVSFSCSRCDFLRKEDGLPDIRVDTETTVSMPEFYSGQSRCDAIQEATATKKGVGSVGGRSPRSDLYTGGVSDFTARSCLESREKVTFLVPAASGVIFRGPHAYADGTCQYALTETHSASIGDRSEHFWRGQWRGSFPPTGTRAGFHVAKEHFRKQKTHMNSVSTGGGK